MTTIRTLSERKRDAAADKAARVEAPCAALAAQAHALGGRFVLFGSAARKTMRWNSDVDLLLDFPPDRLTEAWDCAEAGCAALDLPCDIRPAAWCTPQFLAHVLPDARILA